MRVAFPIRSASAAAVLFSTATAFAAGPDLGVVEKNAVNTPAIVIFFVFVVLTLAITYRAARATKSASDFYAAGGAISPFQNALAIAGDYMSAASFLGISALVFTSGFDGLIYSIGFLVGWPIGPVSHRGATCAILADIPSPTSRRSG